VFERRLSEDAAFRRTRAAKFAREFPVVLEQIAAGEIHLTGLLLLGPHLTEQNHQELLALARHRSKRDILRLIRRSDPKPDAPASVEPLGPAPVGVPVPTANPSWEDFIEALSPPVRELSPGDNPREWTTDSASNDDSDLGVPVPEPEPEPALPKAPERYRVQFTACEEYVKLLQQAKDLSSHALPNGPIEQLHLQAMRLLVAELKKRRCAAVSRPQTATRTPRQRATHDRTPRQRDNGEAEAPRQRGTGNCSARQHHSESAPLQRDNFGAASWRAEPPKALRERASVPAAVRRRVWVRDGWQCTYADNRGIRCRETAHLELHHLHPEALGGPPTAENLTLRCRAHNALAAEQDFGRDFMQAKRADQVPRARASG
jgi:hypothetical protein